MAIAITHTHAMATVQQNANKIVGVVVVAVIGAIVLGAVMPVGVDQLVSANTSGWPDAVSQIFDSLVYFIILLPLAALASMVVDMF